MPLELHQTTLIIILVLSLHAKIEELDEDVAELIHFRSRTQTCESLGSDIKGNFTCLIVDIHYATFGPIGGALTDDAIHDWQVMIHIADGKGRVHHAAMLVVLSSIHRQQAIPE